MSDRDASLDTLLLLDGETFIADAAGKHWVKFAVRRIRVTPERPHGLGYSLTLHAEDGRRLLGFDNAHAIREGTDPERGRVSNTTIGTAEKRCGFIPIWTLPHCWQIFGQRLTQSCKKGVTSHGYTESGYR